ncbi:Hypothetical protein CINCED_3A005516 [Cinara cedri]|uniref:RING-type E3 ubiquitin transferase n=1 Tax=Cinara cedri TaxID=506608 RepID=A0A5E4M670_9HEMI|nr:Hypothetical protein CINCED_3A005516 [Cinara cedri]
MESASRPNESLADSRYFCHHCDAEIGTVTDDFTCPTCNMGFIEKVEQTTDEPDDDDMEFGNPHFTVNDLLGEIDGGRRRSNIRRRRFTTRAPHVMTLQPGRGPRRSSGGTIENLVEDVIVNFADYARSGGSPVRFLLGNPGDYVWGRDGLDSIVSQLLNQIDGAGPPPLTKEKIEEIPTTLISQEQLDLKLQCSVCWEDFKIDEKVMKLVCDHMFHKECIVPWLELHGTCPICRKYLADEGLNSMNTDPLGISLGVGPNLAALIRARGQRNNDSIWGINEYDLASTSSDWPAQIGISLPHPITSSSSSTQTSTGPGMSTYSSVAARNLRDQRLSSSSANVEPMETDHDQNLPAVNNTNNS